MALHEKANATFSFQVNDLMTAKDFYASSYFLNIYLEMKTVKYEFPYLNVRIDYCGDPVVKRGERKKIKLILSNTSKSITSDRLDIYLYNREGCTVLPQNEAAVFLTMAHMGAGIKEVEYEILIDEPLKPIYHFVVEFIFEENKNGRIMHVPVVLVSETGSCLLYTSRCV